MAAAVAATVAAVISACGQQRSGSDQAARTVSCTTPRAAPTPVFTPLVYPPPAGSVASHHAVMIGASDNGRSFCVKPGTSVIVILRGTPDRKWAPIHASSAAVAPRANGHLLLALGVTGAYLVAVHPGTAVLSSARPACAPAISGTASCDTKLAFRATLIIRNSP